MASYSRVKSDIGTSRQGSIVASAALCCLALAIAGCSAAEISSSSSSNTIQAADPNGPASAQSINETIARLIDNIVVTEIQQPVCDTTANCTLNQICMNGRCGCAPNFAWQGEDCYPKQCANYPQMCSQQDPNRVCESFVFGYSHCICRDDYIEDPLTRICRKKCVSDLQHLCERTDSANSLCNVYRCQCKANFRRNAVTGKCEPFLCERDSQCWTEGDKYRSCVNGTCDCTYELDPITQRCQIKLTSLFKARYYYNWRTERILLATIFITPIVFYYCVLQNFRKAKSTVVSFRAPRPGEQFYSHQAAVSIQSPKFMTPSEGGHDYPTVVKNIDVPLTRKDPNGESKQIKYERFA